MAQITEWQRVVRQIITVAVAEGATADQVSEALAALRGLPPDDLIRGPHGKVVGTVVHEDREQDAWEPAPCGRFCAASRCRSSR